jgi:putative CocE/NonD family hydrolase
MIPMRDGVHLATDIFVPTKHVTALPTVLMRLPYDKESFIDVRWMAISFARKGYVVAAQDMRGKYHSEGETPTPLGDAMDGSDTVDWLARQPWSNGRVGTFGCSSLGDTQIFLARMRNPHHVALIASAAGGVIGSADGRYGAGSFDGGIFNLADNFNWYLHAGGKTPGAELQRPVNIWEAVRGLPVLGMVRRFRNDPTDFDAYVRQPLDGPYWKGLGYITDDDRFATPALLVNTWHDSTVADTLALGNLMKKNWDGGASRAQLHVIVGPGLHCDLAGPAMTGKVGDLPVGEAAGQPYNEWFAAWFDYWLRGDAGRKPDLPPYRFYILGEDRWADSNQWPPLGIIYKRWYLGGTSAANSALGGGTLSPVAPDSPGRYDEFPYNPEDPVPTLGGPVGSTDESPYRAGPVDQRAVESRKDVLVYTSPALTSGVRVAGPLSAELYVSSNRLDTDFVVKVVDVRPDGTSINIQEGALRMRYRDGFTEAKLMRPQEIYRARIDLRAIAYYLPPGHRLRVQVTSSNFPRLERNLNTGGNNFDETVGVVALNRVYTTRDRASAVVIPEWPEIPSVDSGRPKPP